MKKANIIILALIISITAGMGFEKVNSQTATTPVPARVQPTIQYMPVGALDIVNNPQKYLYKHVKIVGKFDKFSTLGLDYPPANRSSEKFISFLKNMLMQPFALKVLLYTYFDIKINIFSI